MIWIVLASLSGVVVVSVSAWARASKRRSDLAEAERRERQRLKFQEEALLSRLKTSEASEASETGKSAGNEG